MKIKIIADSSSDVLELKGSSFESVPLTILTDEKEYVDDSTLDVDGMVRDLKEYKGNFLIVSHNQEFLNEVPKGCSIDTTLSVYQYGEGEKFNATFEELAYFTIRMNNGADFLKEHCKALGGVVMPYVVWNIVEKK